MSRHSNKNLSDKLSGTQQRFNLRLYNSLKMSDKI